MTVDSTTVGAPISLVVGGAAGRMGTRIVALARERADLRIVGALEAAGHRALGTDVGEVAQAGTSACRSPVTPPPPSPPAASSWSSPSPGLARAPAPGGRRRACAVIGTTGFSEAQRAEIEARPAGGDHARPQHVGRGHPGLQAVADHGPCAWRRLRRPDHRDPPSVQEGRAERHRRAHGQAVAEALGRDIATVGVYGRHGLAGERPARRSA